VLTDLNDWTGVILPEWQIYMKKLASYPLWMSKYCNNSINSANTWLICQLSRLLQVSPRSALSLCRSATQLQISHQQISQVDQLFHAVSQISSAISSAQQIQPTPGKVRTNDRLKLEDSTNGRTQSWWQPSLHLSVTTAGTFVYRYRRTNTAALVANNSTLQQPLCALTHHNKFPQKVQHYHFHSVLQLIR